MRQTINAWMKGPEANFAAQLYHPALRDAYPRMDQVGVILPWAKDMAAAQALRAFVLGPEGRDILRRYGFCLPGT